MDNIVQLMEWNELPDAIKSKKVELLCLQSLTASISRCKSADFLGQFDSNEQYEWCMERAAKWAQNTDKQLQLQGLKMLSSCLKAWERVLDDDDTLALKKGQIEGYHGLLDLSIYAWPRFILRDG